MLPPPESEQPELKLPMLLPELKEWPLPELSDPPKLSDQPELFNPPESSNPPEPTGQPELSDLPELSDPPVVPDPEPPEPQEPSDPTGPSDPHQSILTQGLLIHQSCLTCQQTSHSPRLHLPQSLACITRVHLKLMFGTLTILTPAHNY